MSEKLRCMTSIYLKRKHQILLLYRQGGRVVNNVWVGSAGGHFEENELNDPEACVLRELKEELGLTADDISDFTLKYIALRRTNNEIRQNYYFFAELKESVTSNIVSNEGKCRWFDNADVLSLDMPVTAKFILKHYLERGMNDDNMYAGITNEHEAVFVELPIS